MKDKNKFRNEEMKNIIFSLILTGWILGGYLSLITENEYIPAIIVFSFNVVALIIYLKKSL
ncbi:hypothetical protein [Arcobacter sp. L]|uniref:hypothetical protein n=1 Tax=Arcobacter sp. L TaxID=944547 RepID=UPI0011D27082|nr:hypothetical protein [Arcobacter sp. L]